MSVRSEKIYGHLSKHVNTGILDQDIFLTLIDNVTKLSHDMMYGE